jgi:O-antigen/teichoic acid export membrane protein
MTKAEKFALLTENSATRRDLRSSSVRAALSSGTVAMFEFALRIGSTAVLARLISPEHFGLVIMVSAVTGLVDQFKDLGLSMATVQRASISHKESTNLFWVNVGTSALLAVLVCAASPLIAAFYSEPRLIPITCAMSATFVSGGMMNQHQALLTRQMRLGQTALVRLFSSVLSTAVAIILAWNGAGYWALACREIVRSGLLTAGMWWCFPWVPSLPQRDTSIREILRAGVHFSGANFFGACAGCADRFILGRNLGAEAVAVYRQAAMFLMVPMDQVLSPLFQVSTPGMSMLQSEERRYEKYYRRLLSLVCLATMPTSVFAAIYSVEATRFLLGPTWDACAPVIAILCLSVFIKQPIECASMVLVTRQKSKRYMMLSFAQNLAWVVALLIAARWGLQGVAWADVALTYALIVPKLFYVLHGSPVTVGAHLRTLVRPMTASLSMGAVLLGAKHYLVPTLPSPVALLVGAGIAVAAFAASWLLIPGGRAEFVQLAGELQSAVRRKKAPAESAA